jgi:lactate dehydrogenase-like 2-hydroxyacid dehydrogenase
LICRLRAIISLYGHSRIRKLAEPMKTDEVSRSARVDLPVVLSFARPVEEIKHVLDGLAVVYTDDSPEKNRVLPNVVVALCYGTLSHLKEMKALRMIQAATAGVDGLPWKEIPEHVTVCGNPGSNADAVAEHGWSLILSQAHNLHVHLRNLKNGVFETSPGIRVLSGRAIGIVGMGSVGRRMGEIARAYRMRVMAITKSGRSSSPCDFVGGPADIDHVLRESDVVVLSLPLTRATRGMIDSRRLSLLRKDCIFVNIGRAELVKREDLIKFLESNPDFRFATDVWWNVGEDYIEDEVLMKYSNFLGTPYVAGGIGNGEIMQQMLREAATNVGRFLRGENPHNIIDRSEYV